MSTDRAPNLAIRLRSRLVGVFVTLANLGAAIALADAVTALAHGQLTRGTSLLGVVVLVRLVTEFAASSWAAYARAEVKRGWRTRLARALALPRPAVSASRSDLVLAIDQAAEEPALEIYSGAAAVALAAVAVVFIAGGWLSAGITLVLLALSVPLYVRAGRASTVVAKEYQRTRDVLESRQLELLEHVTSLRALGAVDYGANELAAISDAEHTVALRAIRVTLSSSLVTEFLSGVSIGLVAMVTGFGLLDGRTTLRPALVAVLVAAEIFVAIRRLGLDFHRRDDARHARDELERLGEPTAPPVSRDLLELEQVVTEASADVVDVRVTSGDRLRVRGRSGSGKTTLLHTMIGWRAPVRGVVRRAPGPVGFVSPDETLLDGTLRTNLLLADTRRDEEARAVLEELALLPRFADLDEHFVPAGLGVSTGERVRLILARALLAGAPLLLLDDIAGVLDGAARDAVRTALERRGDLAVVEASVDRPLLSATDVVIEVTP